MHDDQERPSEDFVEKRVHDFAIWIYQAYVKFLPLLGDRKESCLVIFYCGIGLGLAVLDFGTSQLISLRPLYIIPVVVAALTQRHACAALVSIFIAMLHVGTSRVALSSPEDDFPIFWNLLPTLVGYLFVTETVCLLKRAMTDVLAYNDTLEEELVLMKLEMEQSLMEEA